jgi:hypothetical protein
MRHVLGGPRAVKCRFSAPPSRRAHPLPTFRICGSDTDRPSTPCAAPGLRAEGRVGGRSGPIDQLLFRGGAETNPPLAGMAANGGVSASRHAQIIWALALPLPAGPAGAHGTAPEVVRANLPIPLADPVSREEARELHSFLAGVPLLPPRRPRCAGCCGSARVWGVGSGRIGDGRRPQAPVTRPGTWKSSSPPRAPFRPSSSPGGRLTVGSGAFVAEGTERQRGSHNRR